MMQSNKIVSNDVKDRYVLLETSYRKKKTKLFGQPNIYLAFHSKFQLTFFSCGHFIKISLFYFSKLVQWQPIISNSNSPGRTERIPSSALPETAYLFRPRPASCPHLLQKPSDSMRCGSQAHLISTDAHAIL